MYQSAVGINISPVVKMLNMNVRESGPLISEATLEIPIATVRLTLINI